MLRPLVIGLVAVLCITGVLLLLSVTAGGFLFALGCFTAALALWLLHQGVTALELNASLLASTLQQRKGLGREHPEDAGQSAAESREEGRPTQPVAGD